MTYCCEKCRFFRQPGMPTNPGECHRRAPAIQSNRYWPAVNRDDWCGEFEVREDVKPEQPKPEPKPCMNCGKPCGELEFFNAMTHGPFCGNCAHLIH